MSDLTGNGGRVPATSSGGARALGPVPVNQGLQQQLPIPESGPRGGSPGTVPAGMRTPRTIMADRARKAEALEAARREQAEQETMARRESQSRRQATDEQRRRDRAHASQATSAGHGQPQSSGHRRTQSQQQQSATYNSGYGTQPVPQSTSMGPLPQPPQPGRLRSNTQGIDQPRPIPSQQPTLANAPQRVPSSQPRQQQPSSQTENSRRRASSQAQQPQAEAGPSAQQPSARSTQSSFPHAFERWEELSSHWEGLTSFWIHKLEHDAEEVSRVPLGQQMSRQITDLAAAGANLFHAVVELQRLRASSERKFQRWFFETRADMERAQEMNAELERQLHAERDRANSSSERTQGGEMRARRAEKLAEESKRELAISKDEARRAWEELGRREAEERERVNALREGMPILIGGVQVFPTAAGASRQNSQRQATQYQGQGSYAGQDYPEGASPTDTDPFTEARNPTQPMPGPGQYVQYQQSTTPANSTASQHTVISGALPPQQGSSQTRRSGRAQTTQQPQQPGLYTLPTSSGESQSGVGATSGPERDSASYIPSIVSGEDDGFSASDLAEDEDDYEFDEHGNIRYDAQGRPLLSRRGLRMSAGQMEGADDDEMDVADDVARERELARQYGTARQQQRQQQQQQQQGVPNYSTVPPSSSAAMAVATAAGFPSRTQAPQAPMPPSVQSRPDYEGEGYENYQQQSPAWEQISRHHHPTRLSDVLEEDERSRTTAE